MIAPAAQRPSSKVPFDDVHLPAGISRLARSFAGTIRHCFEHRKCCASRHVIVRASCRDGADHSRHQDMRCEECGQERNLGRSVLTPVQSVEHTASPSSIRHGSHRHFDRRSSMIFMGYGVDRRAANRLMMPESSCIRSIASSSLSI